MSKQEHDKGGQRAPSGASKGETPGDAPKASVADQGAPGDSRASARSDAGRDSAGDTKAASTPDKRDTGKGKPGRQDANKPVNTSKSATAVDRAESGTASKSTQPDTAGSSSEAAKPATGAQERKSSQTTSSSQPSTASTSASAGTTGTGGTGGTGATTPPGGGGSHDGGKRGGGVAGIVALILVLLLALAGAMGGWWIWQKLSDQQAQLSRSERNATAIDELESQLNQLEQQGSQQREQALQSMRSDMHNAMQQYQDEVNQTLDRVLEELASEQETDPGEWLYAEVEYLLRLANQRLQLERDVAGAQSLLRTADERLAQADNPALTPVRRAIQSELGALSSVPSVDRTGLYLTLMAQQEQLAQLPLAQDIAQIAAEGGDTSPVGGAWLEQLERFGQELKELVVVRQHDQALEALMTPEQEAYLRQNARLQLEQAQLALLQANPELYQASLEKAVTLIEGYYDTEHDGVQGVLEQLRSVTGRTIRPELPEISGSLEALRNFMARRQDGGSAGA